MRSYFKTIAIALGCVVAVGVTALASFRNTQNRNDQNRGQSKSQQMMEAESKLPIADYDAVGPSDPDARQKRAAKGDKYEKAELVIDPYADLVSNNEHWGRGLSDIPADKSDVIVVGAVVSAKAYTTHSKTRVYSEFTVQVDEVLKDDKNNRIQVGEHIDIDRLGGRVRFGNGKVGLYLITGQNMPQVDHRYILFLTKSGGKGDYSILTGYEILDGYIALLDNPGSGHPIAKRKDADASSFLNEVRVAVNNP